MAINYNKEIIKSDGRRLVTGGPRDQQRRLKEVKNQESLIAALRDEIKNLKQTEPEPTIVSLIDKDLFTGEQMDEAIRKSVLEALSSKKIEFDKQLSKINKSLESEKVKNIKLTAEIESLERMIKEKEGSLNLERERNTQLITQLSAKEEVFYEDPDRPNMEAVFIDPLEKDSGDHLTAHIDSKKIEAKEKNRIYSNVDKLRGLVGKLPTK